MALEKNREYIADIVGYSSEGDGIARIDGMAVFIPGTLRGERVRAKIIKVGKNLCYGRVCEVLEASPERIESACAAFPKCGGCDLWHMSRAEELSFKTERVREALRRIGGFENAPMQEIIAQQERVRYRNKCMFPVAERGGLISGFYRSHSHDIVECEDCIIQTETANRLRDAVLEWAKEQGIEAYDEKSGKGVLRNIFIRTGAVQDMLCLVTARMPKGTDALVQRLMRDFPRLGGICVNINRTRGNTLLGEEIICLHGEAAWEDTLCGLKFRIPPHSFYQVNRAQAERLYETALEAAQLREDSFVLDLYCGAGTITLCLAKRAHRVLGVEIVPAAIEAARENARINNIKNAEFICADAGEAAAELARRGERPEVIVVDPPRKGLDACGIGAILSMAPERIVYVSCDPATLARDLKTLCAGHYTLKSVTPVDMFPATRHVECCVELCRT